jgi:hypothetical protein
VSVSYDPEIIHTFADKLYSEARWLAFRYGVLFGFVGAAGGAALASAMDLPGAVPSVCVAGVGSMLGAAIGHSKGFELRLRAQLALCQLKTEMNTRPG